MSVLGKLLSDTCKTRYFLRLWLEWQEFLCVHYIQPISIPLKLRIDKAVYMDVTFQELDGALIC